MGQPEATRDKFVGDWMTTGDQGVMDEDGYFCFVGRDDDVITSAGFRIGPGEIEDCLIRHPAVALAAVVGKPDPVRTEIVKAFIVLKSGHAASDALAAEIQGFVKTRLSAHEYPREVAFIDADADDHDRQGDPAAAAREGLGVRRPRMKTWKPSRRLATTIEQRSIRQTIAIEVAAAAPSMPMRGMSIDAQREIDGEGAGINRPRIACARPAY